MITIINNQGPMVGRVDGENQISKGVQPASVPSVVPLSLCTCSWSYYLVETVAIVATTLGRYSLQSVPPAPGHMQRRRGAPMAWKPEGASGASRPRPQA